MAGIQFHFSNGIESPLYETKESIEREWPLEEKSMITNKRRIAKISVRVREYSYIHAIKFSDKDDIVILDLTFDDRECARWSTPIDIPDDQELVGVYCSTSDSFPQCITRVGFILGKFEEQAPKEISSRN